MSLTHDDLKAIREIIRDDTSSVVRSAVREELHPLSGELEALRNDVKEIYDMISDLQGVVVHDEESQKINLEEKLLRLNSDLLAIAKRAGVSLPR
ncbi:MAG TPA: hypothetical protein VIR03_03175 [Candidatus Saccharimonadales bacterium]